MSTRKQRTYRKNREAILKRRAAYYRKNREALVKCMAVYYRENREAIAKRMAAYRRKNREAIAKHKAAYHRKNRRAILNHMAVYRRKNRRAILNHMAVYRRTMASRHQCLLKRHKRQLAPRGVTGRPMSLKEHQNKLYYKDGREKPCWYCSGENNKTGSGLDRFDNDITYTVKNTAPSCKGCNVWRGRTHTVQETRDHFRPMRDAARMERGRGWKK